jgi:hypothetical protein
VIGKGDRGVNMVPKCVHMFANVKMILVETTPGKGSGGR